MKMTVTTKGIAIILNKKHMISKSDKDIALANTILELHSLRERFKKSEARKNEIALKIEAYCASKEGYEVVKVRVHTLIALLVKPSIGFTYNVSIPQNSRLLEQFKGKKVTIYTNRIIQSRFNYFKILIKEEYG